MLTSLVKVVNKEFAMNLGRFFYAQFIKVERKLAGLKAKQALVDDGQISYLIGGKGPVLVLLHGFGANKDNWNRIARHLTKHFTVIIPDIPGFGESVKSEAFSYQLQEQLTRLHQFFDCLGLKEFSLVGNSYGGYLAANYSSRFANKINRLSLLNPLGVESAGLSLVFENIVLGGNNILLPKSEGEVNNLLNKCFVQRPFIPNFVISTMAVDFAQTQKLNHKLFYQVHHVSQNKITFDQPIEQSLRSYSKPVDVYWGEDDKILHPSGAKQLGLAIPNAHIIMLKKTGHLPMLESPKLLADKLIHRFNE